ncbi:conserved hypothetical protein [uncultured Desulfobacterium sp.]|uniref:Queuosine 5'-phosphate N-glycosylase/hydrolase n=1 Tax=uncultured Desulfobacterium sp. TaxID=201089 RepID=A0A445N2M5_9BACT|nr:conserved hypothetical protein [uncultured Desulfobacterium sp.]
MWEALETTKCAAKESLLVQIDQAALCRFVDQLLIEDISPPPWDHRYHFHDNGVETVAYLLVLDTINFCFWPMPGEPRWEIESEGQWLSGYYALAACLKKAVEAGIPITEARYLSRLSLNDLNQLLGGRGRLQLMEERLKNLNELGRILLSHYDGKAHKLVQAAHNSAVALARLLSEKLSSFKDISKYKGREVLFLKRAQLFAADLYGAFEGDKWGGFTDMNELTAFADYKLPQVLRKLGILKYTQQLKQKVDHEILLEPGGMEEIEIRANTVWAVELICRELKRAGKNMNAFQIDNILWNLGQKDESRTKPYHKVVTIFY